MGKRERQEDTVAADFQTGLPMGFVVLADGMGGHSGGDLASRVVVTEVFSALKRFGSDIERMENRITQILERALVAANAAVARCAKEDPARRGMGATLLAPVVFGQRLYWASVGDSPLYLFRNKRLQRLNANHSVAARLEQLVRSGRMLPETARRHPDRACVTSVLAGGKIHQVDIPAKPVALLPGDIVLAASDGIQALEAKQIGDLIGQDIGSSAAGLSQKLLQAVLDAGDPQQDNLSFSIIRIPPAAANHGVEVAPKPRARARRKVALVASAHVQSGQLVFQSLSKSSA
ncbi:PP2C family protein-serine/threonine phosphatase [Tritonibacter aquimaris]|nr:protein phosphatase 2C domain-containing protein [Tritonibacter aquimaris]